MDEFEEINRQIKNAFDGAVNCPLPVEKAAVSALREGLPQLPQIQEGAKVQLPPLYRDYVQESMRVVLADLVQAAAESKQPVMEYCLDPSHEPAVPRLLNIALYLCDQATIHPGFLFSLLEDVVDTSTTQDIEHVFSYLQTIMTQLKKKHIYEHVKNAVLRTCNTLKRRLSKSSNYQLCGKVLVFLAKFFPLSERSGVNVTGATNLTHSITPGEVEAALDSNGEPIDPVFYQKFWGLQSTFQNPSTVVPIAGWNRFSSDLSLILEVFGSKAAKGSASILSGQHPTPEYLCNSRLMSLQLQDSSFRRNFLVQAAILLHTLQTPGRNDKETLKRGQQEQLEQLQGKVFEALEQTPPEGPKFAAAIRQVLQYETHWAEWKHPAEKDRQPCPAWERAPTPLEPPPKRTRIARNQDLEQALSAQTSNMDVLAIDKRDKYHTWKDVLYLVIGDMDPEERVAEPEKVKNNKEWVWRATRLVARQNLEAFAPTTGKEKKGAPTSSWEWNMDDVARRLLPEAVAEIDKKIKAKKEVEQGSAIPDTSKENVEGQQDADDILTGANASPELTAGEVGAVGEVGGGAGVEANGGMAVSGAATPTGIEAAADETGDQI